MARPDFADVYREQLPAVWRYVRARVAEHHEAQDVTSDVFVRAWRSWGRYDASRAVGPWLFGIAHRAVGDWYRRSKAPALAQELEDAMEGSVPGPEELVLSEEMLTQLAAALRSLKERERDALALRFAGRLKMAEIGQVLGINEGAVKMLVSRAIAKLADAVAIRDSVATVSSASMLDDIIDGVLEREHPVLSQDQLRGMVLHLAVMHEPPVPSELADRVTACMECSQTMSVGSNVSREPNSRVQRLLARVGIAPFMGFGWAALAPVCVICTLPVLAPILLSFGFTFVNVIFWFHNIGLATAPVVFFLVYRHFRRHRDALPLSLAGLGAILLVGHIALHHLADGSVAFDYTNRVGDILLLAGTLLNWRALSRWTGRQFALMKAVPQPAF